MPSTYTLISSNVLSSSAASVTFSAIPSTYTDLVLRVSARADDTSRFKITFNSDTSSSYSDTYIGSDGATPFSSRDQDTFIWGYYAINIQSATANTFSNAELYIPSYTASQNKPLSLDARSENNGTTAYMAGLAGLWRNTAAITSVTLAAYSGNIVSGSSFYLYGIKNS
jgi:hypothetical protein